MSVFDKVIGWVAPPSCLICETEGSVLCNACVASEIISYGELCWNCASRSPGGRTCERCRLLGAPKYVWITTNYEGAAQKLIKTYKFGHLRVAADTIADLMAETFWSFNDPDSFRDYVVVAVPSASTRIRQRGFDHSALLAKTIAKRLNMPYLPALGRLGQERQVGRSRQERINQMRGKIFLKSDQARDKKVLVIDDVVTTGGSLRVATKCLRAGGAKQVDALVFAKRL